MKIWYGKTTYMTSYNRTVENHLFLCLLALICAKLTYTHFSFPLFVTNVEMMQHDPRDEQERKLEIL